MNTLAPTNDSEPEAATNTIMHPLLTQQVRDVFGDVDPTIPVDFLRWLGCDSIHQLSVFNDSDLRDYLNDYSSTATTRRISPLLKSQLLRAADCLRRGGSLADIRSSMGTVGRTVDLVHLQVGSERFTTKRSTLCRVEDSYFASMFSGRHAADPIVGADGTLTYFIDRSGVYFEYILEYLRFGAILSEISDKNVRDAVLLDADFYGLVGLTHALLSPKTITSMFLDESTLLLQQKEADVRNRLHRGDRTVDQHEGLLPFFRLEPNGILTAPIRYNPDTEDNVTMLMDHKRSSWNAGKEVTVSRIEQFRTRFNRLHPNILHRLQDILLEEPVIVAGGAVLTALRSVDETEVDQWRTTSDIDLFICTSNTQEASRILERIWFAIAADNEPWWVLRGPGVVNMLLWNNRWPARMQKVQAVLRLYDSPAEVLYGFDVDCCCCCYDGQDVWMTTRAFRALQTMSNVVNPLHAWPNRASYELRLAKYATRGFAIAVPGLDTSRIAKDRVNTTPMQSLFGLARLIKAELELTRDAVASKQIDDPIRADGLKPEAKLCLDALNHMIQGYDGWDEERPTSVILPDVYQNGDPTPIMFIYPELEPAIVTRDAAWSEIVSYTEPIDDAVPSTLLEAWDISKRSREYLNSLTDKDELDHFYYCGAYQTTEQQPATVSLSDSQ